jgi:hypothetical protein
MNKIKRYVRLTGIIATLAASLVLSAAIDGASAKDQARAGSGAISSSAPTERPSVLPEKPVESGTPPPFVNTIHPIIVGRDHDGDHGHDEHGHNEHDHDEHDHDGKHHRMHHHDHDNDHDRQAACECFYPPCPTSVMIKCAPHRGDVTKLAPGAVAPGLSPAPINP